MTPDSTTTGTPCRQIHKQDGAGERLGSEPSVGMGFRFKEVLEQVERVGAQQCECT